MFRRELDEILNMLDADFLKSLPNVAQGLAKIHHFFRYVNDEFSKGKEENQEELVKMLLGVQNKLQAKLETYYKETGMTEEQVHKAAQNVASLPEDCRNLIMLAQHEMGETARRFQEYIKKKGPVQITDKPEEKKAKKSRSEWKKS
jgi:hypothetical protein